MSFNYILTSDTTFEAVDKINENFSGDSNIWSSTTGNNSIISINDTNNISSNDYSFAGGLKSKSNGLYSFAYGKNVSADGDYSFATGESGSSIGDFSFTSGLQTNAIGNYSFASGYQTTAIGDYSFVGVNSVIKNGVKIGSNTLIGMGSVVTKELDCNIVAYGNPAKEIRKNP